MDTATRDNYRQRIDAELRQNILPFWMQQTLDRKRGGFYGEISHTLEVDELAERGALLTSRILWTFSSAYLAHSDPAYLEVATWAYRDLMDRFWDKENGGLFWSASAEGAPMRTRKQVYGQAFGIYAMTEYHRATRLPEPLDRAIEIFRLLERHSRDRSQGGYFEAHTKDWKLEEDVRLSLIDMNEPKSQNTHLHVMEAYTNLLRIWPDAELRQSQTALIEVMLTRILDPKTYHLGLFFDNDWNLKTDRVSFGHDIEAAWLLHEAAKSVGDPALLARVKDIAVNIARVTLEESIDPDGAILYEKNTQGLTNTIKEWWPQAEAAVGFLDAYQISGDERYLKTALGLWDFIETYLVDRTGGEWYRAVSREHVIDSEAAKVSFWKCPYHNGRACLELADRLRTL